MCPTIRSERLATPERQRRSGKGLKRGGFAVVRAPPRPSAARPTQGTDRPTTAKSTQTATKKASAQALKSINTTALLSADHDNVNAMFERYDPPGDGALSKKELGRQICSEWTKHTTGEEEIFHSAVCEAAGDEDMVNEATVEYAYDKDLITQSLSVSPSDSLYDSKIKVRSEKIEHHLEEDEPEMSPKASKSRLDMRALGKIIGERKDKISLPPPN